MADQNERERVARQGIAARVRAVDAAIGGIKDFSGKDALELDALDVPTDWYEQLTAKYGTRTPLGMWRLCVGAVAAIVVVQAFGRADVVLVIACSLLASACYRVGIAAGKVQGYDDGVCAGHSAGVFHAHGIGPEIEREFWDTYHQASTGKNIGAP